VLTFLANNWYWFLFIGAMVFMHAGHGGRAGHGRPGGAVGGHCGGSAHHGDHPQDATHGTAHGTSTEHGRPEGSTPQ